MIWSVCRSVFATKVLSLEIYPNVTNNFPPVPHVPHVQKAGMVHSVSGWTRGVQVKLWDPLRTRAIPECLKGVFTTRRYTDTRLPYLTLPHVETDRQRSITVVSTNAFPTTRHVPRTLAPLRTSSSPGRWMQNLGLRPVISYLLLASSFV